METQLTVESTWGNAHQSGVIAWSPTMTNMLLFKKEKMPLCEKFQVKGKKKIQITQKNLLNENVEIAGSKFNLGWLLLCIQEHYGKKKVTKDMNAMAYEVGKTYDIEYIATKEDNRPIAFTLDSEGYFLIAPRVDR